jgi:hypothetical protein
MELNDIWYQDTFNGLNPINVTQLALTTLLFMGLNPYIIKDAIVPSLTYWHIANPGPVYNGVNYAGLYASAYGTFKPRVIMFDVYNTKESIYHETLHFLVDQKSPYIGNLEQFMLGVKQLSEDPAYKNTKLGAIALQQLNNPFGITETYASLGSATMGDLSQYPSYIRPYYEYIMTNIDPVTLQSRMNEGAAARERGTILGKIVYVSEPTPKRYMASRG